MKQLRLAIRHKFILFLPPTLKKVATQHLASQLFGPRQISPVQRDLGKTRKRKGRKYSATVNTFSSKLYVRLGDAWKNQTCVVLIDGEIKYIFVKTFFELVFAIFGERKSAEENNSWHHSLPRREMIFLSLLFFCISVRH